MKVLVAIPGALIVASLGMLVGCADVPKNIASDPNMPRMTIRVEAAPEEVARKIQSVRALCGSSLSTMSTEGGLITLASFVGPQQIDYVMRLLPVDSGSATNVEISMNSMAGRQREWWPKVLENWFVQKNSLCVAEIRKNG